MPAKFSAVDAKNRFGELLDTAQREPVIIEKHGRPVAVLVSQTDFDAFQEAKLELLRAEIKKGLDGFEAGDSVAGKAFFDDLRAKRTQ